MLALPHGAADTAGIAFVPPTVDTGMSGQVRREVLRHGDRAHARTAAAVRDGKRLVKIEVTHIGADRRRTREPDLRVHVGAVHVHLAAMLVDDGADLADFFLEHTVRRRIRDHQRRELVAMLQRLGAEIGEVDVAVRVARRHDDLETGHGRAGRIGAVR